MPCKFTIEEAIAELNEQTASWAQERIPTFSYVWWGPPPNLTDPDQAIFFGPCHATMQHINTLCAGPRARIRLIVGGADADMENILEAWRASESFFGSMPIYDISNILMAAFSNSPTPEASIPLRTFLGSPELMQMVQRASVVVRNAHDEIISSSSQRHITTTITGKEILALLVRYTTGGFTADTTLVPFISCNNKQVSPYARTTILCASIPQFSVANRERSAHIAAGLFAAAQRGITLGPVSLPGNFTRIRLKNERGELYGPSYLYTDDNFNAHKLITHDSRWMNIGPRITSTHIDVYFNYAPAWSFGTRLAIELYLNVLNCTASGRDEALHEYNDWRGPATMSAALNEIMGDKIQLSEWTRVNSHELGYLQSELCLPVLPDGQIHSPKDTRGQMMGHPIFHELGLVKKLSRTWESGGRMRRSVTPSSGR